VKSVDFLARYFNAVRSWYQPEARTHQHVLSCSEIILGTIYIECSHAEISGGTVIYTHPSVVYVYTYIYHTSRKNTQNSMFVFNIATVRCYTRILRARY